MSKMVYVETSVPSFFQEVCSEPEMLARRAWTRQWWATGTDWSLIDAFGGTSAAAPHVSGAAGLIMATNPDLDGEDAEQILIRTPVDHPQYGIGWDQYSGHGRPNLEAALELASWPYFAERVTGVSGGSATSDGSGNAQFWNVEGLATGVYGFQRYRVDRTMSLATPYVAQPVAWGRVEGSVGWRRITDDEVFDLANEDAGWTEIAAVSSSSITLRSYYYDLYNIAGQYMGRFPSNGSLRFSFTAVGAAPAVGVEDGLAPPRQMLRIVPNPTSSLATVYLPAFSRKLLPGAQLTIYDVSGRRVRRIAADGNETVIWNLATETGTPVAAGVYLLRLEAAGRSLGGQRLLVIR